MTTPNNHFETLVLSLRRRLSDNDYRRLESSVRLRRFSRLRQLHRATVGKADDPLARVVTRIEFRGWLKRSSLETEICRAFERLNKITDRMGIASGASSTDHELLIADVLTSELHTAIEIYTGTTESADRTNEVCVESALELLGLVVAEPS